MSANKAVNVALPVDMAERLRRQAFEMRVSQGLIVATALDALWMNPAGDDLVAGYASTAEGR